MRSSARVARGLPIALAAAAAGFAAVHTFDSPAHPIEEAYERLATQGSVNAQKTLAVLLLDGGTTAPDPSAAIHWLTRAARSGDLESRILLADCYREGRGIDRDLDAAARWYQAAAANSAYAGWRLGELLETANPSRAAGLYERAAVEGFAEAANSLGNLYVEGMGVERDYAKALDWYRRAAAAGHADALLNLSGMYLHGLGIRRDLRAAFALAWFASELQARDAEAFLVEIQNRMADAGSGTN